MADAEYIVDDSGCWLWQRAINSAGYGAVSRNGKKGRGAHRVYYEEHRGPIPAGMVIDHLCNVRRCVNPDHMVVTTQAGNVRRSGAAKLTVAAVRAIRRRYAEGETQAALGREYGVDQSHVSGIVNHKKWQVA